MTQSFTDHFADEIAGLKRAGLYKSERVITSNLNDPCVAIAFAQLVGQIAAFGFVHPDDGAVGPALGKQPAFGGEIAATSAVTVQMIGRNVSENSDIRGQGAGQIGLVAGEFQHHNFTIMGRVKVKHPATDVAAKLAGFAGDLQDVVDQGGGGGFAV